MFNFENDFSLASLSYYHDNDSFQHIFQNCPRHVISPWQFWWAVCTELESILVVVEAVDRYRCIGAKAGIGLQHFDFNTIEEASCAFRDEWPTIADDQSGLAERDWEYATPFQCSVPNPVCTSQVAKLQEISLSPTSVYERDGDRSKECKR